MEHLSPCQSKTSDTSVPDRRRFLQNSFLASILSLVPRSLAWAARDTDLEWDVIVIGSGAAGMTAALTAAKRNLRVLVIEKAKTFGGSTARSGAGIWIRNNEINQAAGVSDSPEEAEVYLAAVAGNDSSREKQKAFLDNGPAMIAFVSQNSPLRFRWMEGYSDYFPDLPGGKSNGASIEPYVLDGRILGKELKLLSPPYIPTPPGIVLYSADYKWLCLAKVNLKGAARAAQCVSRYVQSKLRGEIPLSMGQALAAGLRAGLLEAQVPLWLDTPLLALSQNAEGKVDGVLVRKDGKDTLVRARHGVILASGGFEHNLAMRQQYQEKPITTEWTMGAKENTGDGILSGQRLGAALDLMDEAWWGPTIPVSPTSPYFCLSERSLPGSILVNKDARRFVNESSPYHVVVHEMYKQGRRGEDLPIWLIADQKYRSRYLLKDILPGLPIPKSWFESGAVVQANSLSDLAEKLQISPNQLEQTVEEFNGFANSGIDSDFQRGGNDYDRYYSDPGVKPNPSLAPLEQGPYYAFKIVPGDLGTKGGLRTDPCSRVLREDGGKIKGLYAAGNVSASVMGRSYAGNGSTIGPAMTFGYIAANDIADRKEKIISD